MQPGARPAWLQWLLDKIQLWRIDRARAGIESIDGQIKTQRQETIAGLEGELQAMEEDVKMRAALVGKTLRQELPGNLPGTVASPTGTQRSP